jgi:hypothetical protein
MEWVEAGIQLVAFVVELLVWLVPAPDGSSPRVTRAHRKSSAVSGGARKDDTVLDGSAIPESMNRWAERQDVELRASTFARSMAGWRSSDEGAGWSPISATTSKSDPMWDRELDG